MVNPVMPRKLSGRDVLVRFSALSVVVFCIYGLLLVGDWFLAKQHPLNDGPPVDGRTTIAELQDQGYLPFLSLGNFEKGPLKSFAADSGVAPLGSWPDTKTYYCDEGYGLTTYQSDRFGLRNEDNIWDAIPGGTMLVGDSYTHGACVGDDETIAAYLDTETPVFNLASGGNNPLHYAALLRTFGPVVAPDHLVVLITGGNDYIDFGPSSTYAELFIENGVDYFETDINGDIQLSAGVQEVYWRSLESLERQIADSGEQPSLPLRAWNSFVLHASLPFLRSTSKTALDRVLPRDLASKLYGLDSLPYGTDVMLADAREVCDPSRCDLLFVYIPSRGPMSLQESLYKDMLIQRLEGESIGFVDATDALSSLGAAARSPRNGHLSPHGYEVVSALISGSLQ